MAISNDTYGELTQEELAALRAAARTCNRCGMLADVDPVLHASRYGHAPEYTDATGTYRFGTKTQSWYLVDDAQGTA